MLSLLSNAATRNGSRLDECFQHRDEKALADGLHGEDALELRDLIDGIDVVAPIQGLSRSP